MAKGIEHIVRFFESWRFPVVLISLVGMFDLVMVGLLLMPASAGRAGAFAEAFKVWCFGYDPGTGQMEWAYVWMFLVQPLILIGLALLVWYRPLKSAWAEERGRMWPYAGGALLTVVTLVAGLTAMTGPGLAGAPNDAFPAARLRTAHRPPAFSFINQEHAAIDPAALRGRVTLVTAVYATCGYTCPTILAQAKRAVAALSDDERAGLRVVAVTLDPAHDTPEVLRAMAAGQRVSAPLFNLVTGPPDEVNAVLDRFGFARRRDPETGVVDHVSLFVLIDREGLIAYRFTLGELQEAWMIEALHLLLGEKAAT